jgi:hypothetical protein
MAVDLTSEVPPASEVLIVGSFFGFRPLGNFRLALLSSLSFMALSSMAAFGTLTIVSERLKLGREAVIHAEVARRRLRANTERWLATIASALQPKFSRCVIQRTLPCSGLRSPTPPNTRPK